MSRGIDYGMGTTNIDKATGIRFGVIPMNDLSPYAYEDFEADYGPATCGHCGNEAVEYDMDVHSWYDRDSAYVEYACNGCERTFSSDSAYGDEPLAHYLDDGEYKAILDSYNDVMVLRSPYFTRAGFCSPCAPGACYLTQEEEDGEKAYCFGHEWFEGEKAPYKVFRVDTGEEVLPK